MIKFLIQLVICFVLTALCFLYLGDGAISIEYSGYVLQLSLAMAMILFILENFLLLITYKFLRALILSPKMLFNFLTSRDPEYDMSLITEAYLKFNLGDQKGAEKIATSMVGKESKYAPKYLTLLLANVSKQYETRLFYMHEMLQYGDLRNQGYYLLTKEYFEHNDIKNAIKYGNELYQRDYGNIEIAKMLIQAYKEQKNWEKMSFVIEKTLRKSPEKTNQIEQVAAEGYLCAARDSLGQGKDKTSVAYLEKSLSIELDNFDSMALLCEIYNATGQRKQALTILETALKDHPSYELFDLYEHNTDIEGEELFNQMEKIIPMVKYPEVLIKIAIHLGLSKKVEKLIERSI